MPTMRDFPEPKSKPRAMPLKTGAFDGWGWIVLPFFVFVVSAATHAGWLFAAWLFR